MNAPDRRPLQTGLPLAGLAFAVLADGVDGDGAEARWLAGWRARFGASLDDPLQFLRDWVQAPSEADRGLHELARSLGLAIAETVALSLTAEVEREPMAGRCLAWLQSPVGGSRPTLGLVASVVAQIEGGAPAMALARIASGRALAAGVLRLDAEQRTLPEAALRTPAPLALALAGLPSAWPGVESGLEGAPPLPPSVHAQAARFASMLATEGGALAIRSGYPREARAAAAAFARVLRTEPAFVGADAPPGIGSWLWLTGHIPVFSIELAPGESRNLPKLPGYHGPVLAVTGFEGSVLQGDAPATRWELAIPACDERIALWQTAIDDPVLSAQLGRQHRLPAARIDDLARASRRHARLDGHARLDHDIIAAAARGSGAVDLGSMAQLRPHAIDDDALVLTPSVRQSLEQVLARCRQRDVLDQPLGPAVRARYRAGVRALLVGPSGTGKSLAAAWMATRLGLPLYQVDLASVSSKYIGETEKNLAQLFERAENAEVVLLFDEADALFGKRTDVRDANDRYANNQTNYLLQRIEAFDGLAILTSNSRSRFDSAFSRRLDAIIEFPAPAPTERRELWLAHLGNHHRLGAGDLNQLAGACDLAGGHIRNAVLAATVACDGPVDFAALRQAVESEYRKLGRTLPAGL
ncbi:AAA family ATPase [Montanilutibacter psychrotolerans]|nr:ATP-binding protein [Lysobacter psychrotolerans]